MATKSCLQNLDEWVCHQDEEQRRERISLNDAVLQFYISDVILPSLREAYLPHCHHLDDEHLHSMWEAIDVKELLKEGVVDVVVRILEVTVELSDILLFSVLHQIRGQIFNHSLFASL